MMGCAWLETSDSIEGKFEGGWICGSGVTACGCGRVADYLCDYPMGKGKTCDAPLCERHAISQGYKADNQLRLFNEPPDPETEIHFCPTHAMMAAPKRKRGEA